MFQRKVVALIKGSRARVSRASDHRLVELWSEYSARQYACIWVQGEIEEVHRFVRWSGEQRKLVAELRRLGNVRLRWPTRVRLSRAA